PRLNTVSVTIIENGIRDTLLIRLTPRRLKLKYCNQTKIARILGREAENLFGTNKSHILWRNLHPTQAMRIGFRIIFAAMLLFCVCACEAAAQDFLPELVKRIKPSAVAIETFDSKDNTIARGSGFFIAADRIITNRHVIERAARVEIHLLDWKKFPVRGVLAVDGEGDLALLNV